jgi:hypothetical protein
MAHSVSMEHFSRLGAELSEMNKFDKSHLKTNKGFGIFL